MTIARINTFIAAADHQAELGERLESIVGTIRSAAGCQSATMLQAVDEPVKFVIYEVWDSVDAHQQAAGVIPADLIASTVAMLAMPPSGEYFTLG